MHSAEAFWDKSAKKYAKSPIKNMPAYIRTMERTKAHLSAQDHALEIACGTASTALLLSEFVQRITASDISSEMIEIGRRKAGEQQTGNIDFLRAGLFEDSLDGQTYDVVMSFNFLHLLEDIPGGLQRIHSLVRPGGRFISKTPCLADSHKFLKAPIWVMRKLGMAPHVTFLSVVELEAMIAQAGFHIVETGMYPDSPASRFIVAEKRRT